MSSENPLPLLFFVTQNSSIASNYKVILSLYGRYLAMDFDFDGNWQAVLFHNAPLLSSAVHKLLVYTQIRIIGL